MFGMEEQVGAKKGAVSNFKYEFEKEMKSAKNRNELTERLAEIEGKLKNILRAGAENDDYLIYSALLQGYEALKKIIKNLK